MVTFSVAERELILKIALGFHLVIASFRLYLNILFVMTAAILAELFR